jgi:hypothetical protein
MNGASQYGGEPADPDLAPVFGTLVRLLGATCLAAATALLIHGGIWAVLAFTEVRTAGLESVVAPEAAEAARVMARPAGAAAETMVVAGAASDPAADLVLSAAAAGSTAVGMIALLLLPAILLVSFLVAILRSPRSAGPCLGGLVWSLVVLAVALPWSRLWPELAWGGLWHGYAGLLASSAAGPALGSILVHAVMPLVAAGMLVLISWRAGNALHADLLAAEALSIAPETERETAAIAARGVVRTTSCGEGSPLRRVA